MTQAWKPSADQHRKTRRKVPELRCISGAKHPNCSIPNLPRIQPLCAGNGAKLPSTGSMHFQTLRCSAPGKSPAGTQGSGVPTSRTPPLEIHSKPPLSQDTTTRSPAARPTLQLRIRPHGNRYMAAAFDGRRAGILHYSRIKPRSASAAGPI